jgi:glycosyltransferase involved in cell wall biosynthesis
MARAIIKSDPVILLSICIPTFNRSEILKKSIDSLVNQDAFIKSNFIEIVISDNCSSDDTKFVVLEYIKKFGSKIKYSKTSQNIFDKNIERALSLGNGKFLKLSNDTLLHLDGSLEYYLYLIKENINNKSVLFFTNGLLKFKNEFSGSGINQFVEVASYYSTWIASFGIWRSDFELIYDFGKSSNLNLSQVDNLLETVQRKNSFVITNVKLFDIQEPSKKGGFDIVTVFLDNYSLLLSKYLKSQDLTLFTFENEMQLVVKRFIINGIMLTIFFPLKYNYLYKNAAKRILHFFRKKPLFIFECSLLTLYFFFKHLTKKVLILLKLWK